MKIEDCGCRTLVTPEVVEHGFAALRAKPSRHVFALVERNGRISECCGLAAYVGGIVNPKTRGGRDFYDICGQTGLVHGLEFEHADVDSIDRRRYALGFMMGWDVRKVGDGPLATSTNWWDQGRCDGIRAAAHIFGQGGR